MKWVYARGVKSGKSICDNKCRLNSKLIVLFELVVLKVVFLMGHFISRDALWAQSEQNSRVLSLFIRLKPSQGCFSAKLIGIKFYLSQNVSAQLQMQSAWVQFMEFIAQGAARPIKARLERLSFNKHQIDPHFLKN
jgi:hypothetical protein